MGYEVSLTAIGSKKIGVIKTVRELTDMGLKEAKTLVESTPCVVLTAGDPADAEKARDRLEAAGASASVTEGGQVLTASAVAGLEMTRCPHCHALSSGVRCENCGAPR